MQSRSEPGRLHVAEAAAHILRDTGMFKLTDRGEMAVKGRVFPNHFCQPNLSISEVSQWDNSSSFTDKRLERISAN